jgi:hypothetical protein
MIRFFQWWMERLLIIMCSFTTGSTVAVAARGRLDLCIDFDGCCFCFSLLATFGASVLATALRPLPSSGSGLVFYMCLCSSRPLLHAACSTTMWGLDGTLFPSSIAALSMNIDNWSQSWLVQRPLLPSRLLASLNADSGGLRSAVCQKTKENMNQQRKYQSTKEVPPLQYSLNGS